MHSVEKDQVDVDVDDFRLLALHGAVGQEKDDNVQRDESEGDVGPAAAAHVFVPQRNEQFVFSPKRETGIGRCKVSLVQNRVI